MIQTELKNYVPPEKSAVVMFSGGLDSTVSAIQMAKRFQRVVLMTVDLPYTINLRYCTKNLIKLRTAFPDVQIEHMIINGNGVRRSIWSNFCDDYFTFCKGRGIGITCLGCKMTMMVLAIKVCLRDGIGHLSNGITRSQIAHPHSTPQMVNRFGDFIAEYNIVYINDVYEINTRKDEMVILEKYNLDQGIVIGASSITHQPRCFIGPPTKLWLEAAPINRDDMLDYFDNKIPVMRDILAPYAKCKRKLRNRPELHTRVDESFQGYHTYEFSPLIDRFIGLFFLPVWLVIKNIFFLCRKNK